MRITNFESNKPNISNCAFTFDSEFTSRWLKILSQLDESSRDLLLSIPLSRNTSNGKLLGLFKLLRIYMNDIRGNQALIKISCITPSHYRYYLSPHFNHLSYLKHDIKIHVLKCHETNSSDHITNLSQLVSLIEQ